MKKIIPVFISISFLFSGCYFIAGTFCKHPDVLIKKEFNGEGIAVLTFGRSGMFISPDIGNLTADRLADELFLSGKYEIIDRSKVNAAQAELEISNPNSFSQDKIHQLGLKLKANYLILGRISSNPTSEYFELDKDKKMNISFRIISVLNTDVVGIVDYTRETTGIISIELDSMIKKIVQTMVEQNE
jgi:hypothetical protein